MEVLLRTRWVLLLMLIVLLVGLLGLVGERLMVAHASATFTNCPSEGDLRAAVSGGGTVVFNISSSCTITLTTGPLLINQSVTLDNQGQRVTLDGGGTVQVIQVSSGVTFALNALTIANGSAVLRGGGLENDGGTVNITNSTFASNTADEGGGLENESGMTNIRNSTFANNTSTEFGSALDISSGTVNITNSTFASNTASTFGLDASGLSSAPGTLFIAQSIVANNSPRNCIADNGGIINDGGYNLSNDASCGFTDPTSRQGINPQLDPAGLGNNGGPTQTIALQPSSPAIDFIPARSVCKLTSDQRGFPRPDNGESVCDIGAYEFQDCQVRVSIGPEQGQATGGQASGQANSTARSNDSTRMRQRGGVRISSSHTNNAATGSNSSATGGTASTQTGPITVLC